LIIIGTTSRRTALEQLDLLRRFQKQIAVPNVNSPQELAIILQQSGDYSDNDIREVLSEIQANTGRQDIGVSVKTILNCIGTAKQQPDARNEVFAKEITDAIGYGGY
jgi:vesicle-fusing ATPase